MIIRPLLLSAAVGMGVFLPAGARSVEPAVANEPLPAAVNRVSQGVSDPISESPLNIELRLDPQPDGKLGRELTFSGNANELIVLTMERQDELPIPLRVMDLYSPTGEQVRVQRNYPDFMAFGSDYFGSSTRTFLLPETGDYRLVLGSESVPVRREDDFSAVDASYLVQVREATYYERLMISAETLADDEQYPAAFFRLALAVDDSPEIPAAYFFRVVTYAEMLYGSPEFEAQLADIDFYNAEDVEASGREMFALIYETFLTLDADDQAVVKDDFRQLERLYTAAIANGDVDPTEYDIGEAPFDGISDFLETGEPTETMRLIFFGTDAQTQAPL